MNRAVLYITRTEWELYVPTIPTIIKITVPQTAVRDLDVISEEQVFSLLQSTFAANKIIPPLSFVIVLSDTTVFMKDFPKPLIRTAVPPAPQNPTTAPNTGTPQPVPVHQAPQTKAQDIAEEKKLLGDQDKAVATFIEKVPFEETAAKTITTDKERRVIVANKTLFTAVKNSLGKAGYVVEAVVPAMVFQKVLSFTAGFTPQAAIALLTHSDLIRQNDLSSEHVITQQSVPVDPKTGKEKPNNMRQFILIGVFVFLLLFMVVLYYLMYMRPKPKTTRKSRSAAVTTIAPTAAVQPTTSASTSAALLSSLKIQINAGSQSTQNAQKLKTTFTSSGIPSVTITSSAQTVAKTLVLFSSDVPESARAEIMTEVQKLYPTASSQENGTKTSTVVITLSQS